MADVIVIGSGPAGISAALYTARAGLKTLVIGKTGGSLPKADKIENYFGFAEPVSGKTLLENGIAQARRVGVKILDEEAVGLTFDGSSFAVASAAGTYRAPYAVIATGTSRVVPKLPGLADFEGRGVSYCAVCDGFFYRKKRVAVLGGGEYALHEASELLAIAEKVTVLTDGRPPAVQFPPEMEVDTREIASLCGNEKLGGARFSDGSVLHLDGLFVALGTAGGTDLARKIGAELKDNTIVTDENRQTNVPHLYAAGDCTGGLLQISKAVCDGAIAGTSAAKSFRAG